MEVARVAGPRPSLHSTALETAPICGAQPLSVRLLIVHFASSPRPWWPGRVRLAVAVVAGDHDQRVGIAPRGDQRTGASVGWLA